MESTALLAEESIRSRLTAAQAQCLRLLRLLEEEFGALRAQDLKTFESLQVAKADLLADLTSAIDWQQDRIAAQTSPGILAAWESFRMNMLECRELHRRNELLILRKRDAVRGALQALVGGMDATSSVEVYDRLGRVKGTGRRRNPYAQA